MKKWLDEEYEFEVEVDALQQQKEACLAQVDAIGGFLVCPLQVGLRTDRV